LKANFKEKNTRKIALQAVNQAIKKHLNKNLNFLTKSIQQSASYYVDFMSL